MKRTHLAAAMTVGIIGAVGTAFAQRPAANMSFFVTSSNPKAETSAASRAAMRSASRWRKPRARAARPGTPI